MLVALACGRGSIIIRHSSLVEQTRQPVVDRVTRLPVEVLLTPEGVELSRGELLDREAIRRLLRAASKPRFVVADVGAPLKWIEGNDVYEFWKVEVQHRLAERDSFSLEDFPGERAYVATAWRGPEVPPVVLLELHH